MCPFEHFRFLKRPLLNAFGCQFKLIFGFTFMPRFGAQRKKEECRDPLYLRCIHRSAANFPYLADAEWWSNEKRRLHFATAELE